MVVSTSAGSGAGRGLEAALHSLLSPHVEPHFLYPSDLEELHQAIDSVVRSGSRRLAVAGGDGTIHRVVNALAGASITLAPIPFGSGNDFCRGIGLSSDPAAAVAALATGRTRTVDLVSVNGTTVCTVAGLGLVADTGVAVGRLLAPGSPWRGIGRALGSLVYTGAAGARLLLFPRVAGTAHLTWLDGRGERHEASRRVHAVLVANLPTFGAGLRLPVTSRPDDGAFELISVLEGSRLRLARSLSCLRSNRQVPPGTLEVVRATAATIEWEGGSRLLADGEDLGSARHFEVRAVANALRVPAPI